MLRDSPLCAACGARGRLVAAKVVDHIEQRVPVLAVVGRREAEERSLVLRRLPGREQETLPLAEAIMRLAAEATAPDLKASA